MKKLKIVLIILVLTGMLFILAGCTTESSAGSVNRFVKVIDEGTYEVICDTKTKVLYLKFEGGCGYQGYGGLTILVDAEGKPLLYEKE